MSSSRRGSFVIHKGWEAQDNDQLTVRVGDVVMMEKSKRCGWSTLVNGQHWVIGVVDGKEGKFPLSHLTYRSLPESPNQVIGLAVATCDNYSAIKMIGGYIRYGKNEVIRITKKSHSDSEPWEGVSLWNNHGKIPAANLVEVPPSIPHPLEARFRKQLDEAGVFDRVTQLPKGLSLAPNVLAFLKSEDACTIIAGSVWKGLFVTLVALAHSKLTTYEPEEQQSSPSLADILDFIPLVRMQTSDISAPSVQQVAHLLPLIADKESPLRHYAAMLFSQLEPWASDATRELALQHLEMLYEYSRSRHFIFRRFTARRIKLPDTEHKFGVFLTAGTLAVKYDRRIETWDQSHIELTLLSFLSHPNIVTAFGGTTLGSTRIIVMERMEMHLDTMIQEHFRTATDRESKQLKFNLYRQMLRGLIYLHSFNICHRDIKPSNIMVNRPTDSEGWRLKLIDVGVSRVAAPDITCTEKGIQSAHYPAPELRCSSSEAEDPEGIAVFRTEGRLKGDVYSLGWVISELWFEQRKARPQTGDNLPNALRLLIEECLSLDWWTRPTAEQAFQKVLQAEDIHTHM